jgi:hypothetical protein
MKDEEVFFTLLKEYPGIPCARELAGVQVMKVSGIKF